MANIKVELNLNRRFNGRNMDKARYAVANQAMADMDQFVPYKNGTLSSSVHVTPDGKSIIYSTSYAKSQFYGVITNHKTGQVSLVRNYTRTEHPLAGRRWDLRAKALYGQQWANIAKNKLMGD